LTSDIEVASVDMDFSYSDAFGEATAPAYETLLLDVMIGEATLFTRSDEVEAAWRVVDPVLKYWESNPPRNLETYPAGSSGPDAAIDLAAKNQVRWRAL
jgi:glucose-6-phosphate 1-dehydrogenase